MTISLMNTAKGFPLFAVATAITALGFVTVAPLAQAAPDPCAQYAFNGNFVIQGSNTGQATVFPAGGTQLSAADAAVYPDDLPAVHGFASGGIQGRDIDFTISWLEESDSVWTFTGTIGDEGLVHRGIMHGPGFMGLWDSTTPLACNDPDIATKPLPGSVITPPSPATTRVPVPVTAP